MEDIVTYAGYITGIAAAIIILWRVIRWSRNITEGLRCLLRSDMLHTYYKRVESREIRQYEAEEFKKSYAGYKALDGNSFIDDIAQEVSHWRVVS